MFLRAGLDVARAGIIGGVSSESPPEEPDRVRGLVASQLVEFGDRASVETVWSDKAKMWFVEVRPHNPDAAFISIGVEGDTVFLHAGDEDAESWGRGTPVRLAAGPLDRDHERSSSFRRMAHTLIRPVLNPLRRPVARTLADPTAAVVLAGRSEYFFALALRPRDPASEREAARTGHDFNVTPEERSELVRRYGYREPVGSENWQIAGAITVVTLATLLLGARPSRRLDGW